MLAKVEFNRKFIRDLIQQLESLDQSYNKTAIIKALTKFSLSPNKFSISRVSASCPVLIEIISKLIVKLEAYEYEKARTMASSVHNYPGFITKRYKISSEDFLKEHINYYTRVHGEEFLKDKHELFINFYPYN